MNIELFKSVGEAAYGSSWQSSIQRDLGLNHRQRITQWLDGTRPIPNLTSELLAILNIRKVQIDNAIKALSSDFYINEKVDLNKSFIVVSEGGYLLDEQFNTIEDAKKWVETWDEEDQYLANYHQMTVAEQYALETMQEFDDIYPAADVLKAIKSGQFEKSEQEYYTILCELDENHLGREYYEYFIANEFNLTRNPNFSCSDEDSYDYRKTISYKQFIIKKIAQLLEAAANVV